MDVIERLIVAKDQFGVGRPMLRDTLNDAANELEAERRERQKLDRALREKDAAMGVLFDRLAKAGVDCSDLIS